MTKADRSSLGFLNGPFGAFILNSDHWIRTRRGNFDFIFSHSKHLSPLHLFLPATPAFTSNHYHLDGG